MKQRSFFNSKSEFSKSRISYGGNAKGRKKVFRPLDRKRPLHITLKSSQAKGKLSLLTHKLKVSNIIETKAQRYRIKIHRTENMGNHFHLFISFKSKTELQNFLRTITGLIARTITKARKGKPQRFWDHLAHTRIITSRKDFASMHNYMNKNQVERDHGPQYREGMEQHEKIEREMRRRGVSRATVMNEWLEAYAAQLNICV